MREDGEEIGAMREVGKLLCSCKRSGKDFLPQLLASYYIEYYFVDTDFDLTVFASEKVGGVEVKRLRSQMGLTQDQLAMLFECSPAAVKSWEQNIRQPRGPVLILINSLRCLIRDGEAMDMSRVFALSEVE